MTIMRLSLVGSTLTDSQKELTANRLIEAFAAVEVGREAPEVKSGFLVHFEEVARADLWMGDRPMGDATAAGKAAVVSARVMAGPWTNEMKSELFERIERIVRDATEMPKEGAGTDFWMTIVEVPEGAWGVGGRNVSIEKLAPVFAEDRQARIREHMATLRAKDSARRQ